MPSKTIKVFVVDDSSLFRKMIIDYLSSCPDIQVVGYAFNAYDARKKIPVLKPDVITMDVEMPGLNGIDFLKDFLPLHPIPVVLVSSLNLNVFDVLSAGAVDFVRKPDMNIVSKEQFFSALNSKIHIASFAKVRCASRNHINCRFYHYRAKKASVRRQTAFIPVHGHCAWRIYRRYGSDSCSFKTASCRYSRHGHHTAYARGIYRHVCTAPQ